MPRPSYAHNQLNGNLSARVDLTLPNFEDGYVPPPLHLSYNSQCKGAYRYMGFELADGWVLSTLPLLAGDRQQLIPHIEEGHSCLSTCDADGFVTIFYQCVDTSSYRATPGDAGRAEPVGVDGRLRLAGTEGGRHHHRVRPRPLRPLAGAASMDSR